MMWHWGIVDVERDRTAVVCEVDGDIEASHVRLHSPLPPDFPAHPPEIEYLSYLRYRLLDGPDHPSDADAILVMQPGGLCGAYTLDRVARNTLRAAQQRGSRIEWWSLARRGDGASDTTGIDAAREAGDPSLAFDYYYRGREVDGRTFAGFRRNGELAYVAELGIERAVLDERELLLRELPEPWVRRAKVFLGGHSFGCAVTAAYSAWDFDGTPGHEDCAGLIALDLLVGADPFRLRRTPGVRQVAGPVAGAVHRSAVALLRAGLMPRVFAGLPFASPEMLNFGKLLGLLALHRPADEAAVLADLPRSVAWHAALRLWSARTVREVVSRRHDPRAARLTGRALLGTWAGSSVTPISLFQVGLGTLDGGPLAPVSFPAPAWAYRVPLLSLLLTFAFGPGPRLAAAESDRLYGWRRAGRRRWPVDIDDFARLLAGGPLGYAELYFPIRLLVDGLFWAGAADGELSAIRHDRTAATKPKLTILGDDSNPVPILLRAALATPPDAVRVRGYTHFDIVAAERPPDGGEPVSDAIAAFVTAS